MLCRTWQAALGHNERISGHLKSAEKELERQRGLLETVSADLKAGGGDHPIYNGLANVLLTYNDIYRAYARSLERYHHFFETINLQFGQEAPANWQAFSDYSNDIRQISSEYQHRRKVFLEKEEQRLETMTRIEKKFEGSSEGQSTMGSSSIKRTSVIDGLGMEHHSRKEVVWL